MNPLLATILLFSTYANAWCRFPVSQSVRPATRGGWTTYEIGLPKPMVSPSDIMRMFDEDMADLVSSLSAPSSYRSHAVMPMQMDAVETSTGYEIYVDLPGVDKKDISISIKGDEMTISAERAATLVSTPVAKAEATVGTDGAQTDIPAATASPVTSTKEDSYLRRERRTGTFSRTFTLPENADKNQVRAENTNGVLKVTIAKRAETIPHERKIDIN